MTVRMSLLCLVGLLAGPFGEALSVTTTSSPNVISQTSTPEIKATTKELTTATTTAVTSEVIICYFPTTQITTTYITFTLTTPTFPTTTTLPTTPNTMIPSPMPMTSTMFTTVTPFNAFTTTLLTSIATTQTPATTRTSTATRTTTRSTTPIMSYPSCQNGGYYDGIKCVCRDIFFGSLCELIIDKIVIGSTVTAQVNVELSITNRKFTEDLVDPTSQTYQVFENIFKTQMSPIYSSIPGYKDLIIQKLRPGSIIVNHSIIIELEYKNDSGIVDHYKNILEIVEEKVHNLKFIGCTSHDGNALLCVGDNFSIEAIVPPSEEELCRKAVPGFGEFYDPLVTSDGLICISHCDLRSSNYVDCNSGACVIQKGIGPQCLCPRTVLYIYTSSRCSGKVAKLGLFVGGGVTIGVLVIIIFALGIYFHNIKKRSTLKSLLTEETYYSTVK